MSSGGGGGGGFYGTDAKEKQGAQNLSFRPQLDGSQKTETQAKHLTAYFSREDDLTFKEYSVRDVSDRGRGQVVELLVQGLVDAVKRVPAQAPHKEAQPPGPMLPTAAAAPPWVHKDVLEQLGLLRAARASGRISGSFFAAAAEPLRRLATLPVDAIILKKTKVALELNEDFWKKSPKLEVRQMVAVLVKQWKAMYRSETGTTVAARGPSERSLRNLATDLEECAFARVPRISQYQELVKDLLQRLEKAPACVTSLIDGTDRSSDLVQRVSSRSAAERAARTAGAVPAPAGAAREPALKKARHGAF